MNIHVAQPQVHTITLLYQSDFVARPFVVGNYVVSALSKVSLVKVFGSCTDSIVYYNSFLLAE